MVAEAPDIPDSGIFSVRFELEEAGSPIPDDEIVEDMFLTWMPIWTWLPLWFCRHRLLRERKKRKISSWSPGAILVFRIPMKIRELFLRSFISSDDLPLTVIYNTNGF